MSISLAGVPRWLQILQGPENITVAIGTQVSMHCAVGGFPVPMVHWFKDGCLLTNRSVSFSLQNNGQLLIFRCHTAGGILILIVFIYTVYTYIYRSAVCTFGYFTLFIGTEPGFYRHTSFFFFSRSASLMIL